MSKLALRAQTVDIGYLPLRQGFFGKKRFNDRSKVFPFGQQPGKSKFDPLKLTFTFSSTFKELEPIDQGEVLERIITRDFMYWHSKR